MKKSKKASISNKKAGAKKASKNTKSLTSVLKKNLKKPGLGKTVSKAVKLLVKMSAKPAKKAQVKVPAKAAKTAAKTQKNLPVKSAKNAPVKPTKAAPAPAPKKGGKTPAPVVTAKAAKEAAKDLKKGGSDKKAAPAPVVAAVLSTKGAKGAKAAKVVVPSERMCRELACENMATTKGYCRLDYIKNWKKIKRKEMILKEGKLNQYIEELVGKYPDKYIDVIRQDLSTEVNFNKVIHDLELDESIDDLDYDGDSIDALIGGIKKDIEDIGGGGEEEF